MRKKFIAGNWKMNLDNAAAVTLARELTRSLGDFVAADVAVCPSFVYLSAVAVSLKGGSITLGAQDVFYEANGAFTGEVSVAMLKDVGCTYTIIGHSERRHIIGEGNALINRKTRAALAGGVLPILCIGELLEERERGKTEAVLEEQLREGLVNISAQDMCKITIAYEPVWAIGTGKTASPQQAQDAHAFCRKIIADIFDKTTAQSVRIQYGGSVKADNAAELLGQPDVDGALVGGASLKVNDFIAIVKAGAKT
ncbi:MAG: triose-phosphate isomerase [Sedimentisphaerales bacterium]|nr:triose-phosphate isomerase [Sedimentisphaerales bacterium]